ncbi:Pro-kumamolisin, activation domain-containing protein, partial [Hygrophoropsis aurantiaca]
MRSVLASLVVIALGLLASADPILSPYSLHEKRTAIPAGWSYTRKHDSSAVLPLRFALTQSNIDDIEKHLMDVSHPQSPNYGNHWSAGDVLRMFAPSQDTIDAVRSWLSESGIDEGRVRISPNKGWIVVDATVEEAERLLQTEYHVYGHASGKEHVACDAYHLPEHIVPHVDFVTPTVHFDAKITKRSDSSDDGTARTIGQPGYGSHPKTTGAITT